MALTRAQLLSGNSSQGVVLPGQVQAVSQGAGVTIAANGQISVDASTVTGLVKLNNATAYNAYVWPALAGAPAAGAILQTDGVGNLLWTTNYIESTSSTGAATLPSGTTAQRPAPQAGDIRYNTETGVLEYSDGVSWIAVISIDPSGLNPTVGLGLKVDGESIKTSVPIQYGPPSTSTLPQGAMDGSTYWDDNLGVLFIRYNDGTSTQWVQAIPG